MKTMKKLQVAVAVASLFAAAGSSMAASVSQSGVTIAREAVSANVASTQTVRAPTVTYNFDNGPAANSNGTQDFNVTLTLGGDGDARWAASSATYKTISAVRRNNGNAVVAVLPASSVVPPGKVALQLLGVDVVPASGGTPVIVAEKTYRYKFRLVNNSLGTISIGDLNLGFNGQNPGDGPPGIYETALPEVTPAANVLAAPSDYQSVKNVQTVVNGGATIGAGLGAGETGNVEDGCGRGINKITVTARNYNGSGDGVEGESAGAPDASITNSGYIQFNTALGVKMDKGVAIDRNTDPLNGNQVLVANGLANSTSMALGTVRFQNRALDAADLLLLSTFYKLGINDLNDVDNEKNGNVDVASLRLNLEGTNGFTPGAAFRLSNSPTCGPTAGTVVSSPWVTGTFTAGTNPTVANKFATVTFNIAQLGAAFDLATSLENVTDALAANFASPFTDPGAATRTNRAYVCMQVPGGVLIPQSRFTGFATLVKSPEDTEEQANFSCPAPLAGLGGGIKIDVRNYFPYDPAAPGLMGYVRIINNSETVSADITAQYIRADGTYGRYVSLGTLPPRAAKFFSSQEIDGLMLTNGTNSSAGGVNQNATTGLAAGFNRGFNARLRISSEAASTLRVQNYLYVAQTGALVEMSASQGADFVNVEASSRDHIDQDAQTGIKK